MDSRRSVKYSRTSLQRTPTGPGPSVRWGGVRPFAGVHSTTLECSRAWSSPCKPKGRGVSLPQQNCLSVYHFHGHSQNLDSLYTQNEILAQSWLDPGFYRIQLYECKGKRLLQYVTLVYWSTPPPFPLSGSASITQTLSKSLIMMISADHCLDQVWERAAHQREKSLASECISRSYC